MSTHTDEQEAVKKAESPKTEGAAVQEGAPAAPPKKKKIIAVYNTHNSKKNSKIPIHAVCLCTVSLYFPAYDPAPLLDRPLSGACGGLRPLYSDRMFRLTIFSFCRDFLQFSYSISIHVHIFGTSASSLGCTSS